MGKTKRKTFSLRLDEELMNMAREMGLDVNRLIESELRKALKVHKCPVCGVKNKTHQDGV